MWGRMTRWCGYLVIGAVFALVVTYGPTSSSSQGRSVAEAALLTVGFACSWGLCGVVAQVWRRRRHHRAARTS